MANITSTCSSFLHGFQKCLRTNYTNEIYIPLPDNLEIKLLALSAGCLNLNDSYHEVFMPFMCLYHLPACNDPDSTFYPSSQGCSYISSDECQDEFHAIAGMENEFPMCKSLPINYNSCVCKSQLMLIAKHNFKTICFKQYKCLLNVNNINELFIFQTAAISTVQCKFLKFNVQMTSI